MAFPSSRVNSEGDVLHVLLRQSFDVSTLPPLKAFQLHFWMDGKITLEVTLSVNSRHAGGCCNFQPNKHEQEEALTFPLFFLFEK